VNFKNKIGFYLLLFSQFLPELFFYSNDIFLLIYFIYLIYYHKYIYRKIIPPLLFTLFFLLVKIIFSQNFPLNKQFLSDFRPFLVFGILYYINDLLHVFTFSEKLKIFFIIIILLSIPNILGLINQTYYSSILKYYYKYVIGGFENSENTNIAQISSLNGRFSSIFGQPATAGSFFFITCIISIRLLYYKIRITHIHKLFLFTILILSIFNGYVTSSAFFQFGFILLLIIYSFLNSLFLRFVFFCSLIFILIILNNNINELTILFDYITSSRYNEDGNIMPLMKQAKFSNLFFGFFYIDPSTKSAGDSSIWMKFVQGGILYLIFYYFFLYKNINKMFLLRNKYKIFYIAFFLSLFFGEIGFTVFSQPKSTFLSFLLLKLFDEDI
jgi:hypothetical protein